MLTRRASHPQLSSAWALLWLCACHPRSGTTPPLSPQVTICYALTFAPWEAPDSATFSNAPVGLVAPLPDTIALTPVRVVQRTGPPQYELLRQPVVPSQPGATWIPGLEGGVTLWFPEAGGQGLIVSLRGTGLRAEGRAGIYLDERPSDLIRLTPITNVTATRVVCPYTLLSPKSGA